MDPTQALHEIRTLAQQNEDELATKVEGLDQWLTGGGFLPEQWNNRGRPRLTEAGPILEGVTHGKASTYSKGCKCIPCREANRKKSARWRQSKKEN